MTGHGLRTANALAISPRAMPLLVSKVFYAWSQPTTVTHPTINPLTTSAACGKKHKDMGQNLSSETTIRFYASATRSPENPKSPQPTLVSCEFALRGLSCACGARTCPRKRQHRHPPNDRRQIPSSLPAKIGMSSTATG